jgi:hypothetical protein
MFFHLNSTKLFKKINRAFFENQVQVLLMVNDVLFQLFKLFIFIFLLK